VVKVEVSFSKNDRTNHILVGGAAGVGCRGITYEGVATARSKSRNPPLIFSTSSSVPTAVAPAYTGARK